MAVHATAFAVHTQGHGDMVDGGDDNGHSHVRSALLGPSFAVPFSAGDLTLGTWQQIILCDFDTRARERTVVAQVMGE
jgi:secondary thiamine-phosphate synthase enzyme